MNDYKTNTPWTLWYHSIKNNEWNKNSYKKIMNVNNLYDYYLLKTHFERQHLQNGMFFVMRDEIFPTWEDPDNRLGGCLSFKIESKNILDSWNKILLYLISENLVNDNKDYDNINGISIAPKKEFNIIKIWLKDDSINYKNILKELKPYFIIEGSLYKKHELEY